MGADGIICGHIHHAAIRDIDGIRYMNTGDFVESCTAIAEHEDGRMEILYWHNHLALTISKPALHVLDDMTEDDVGEVAA